MSRSDDAARRHAEEIGTLHREAEQEVAPHRLRLERLTASLATPGTLYAVLLIAAGWIAANTLGSRAGLPVFDAAPFPILQLLTSVGSLVLVLLVLLKQERQAALDQERGRLVLQITMLTDRRSAKLVQLFERLRQDLGLPVRTDREQEELRTSPDLRHQRDELQRTMNRDETGEADKKP